MKLLKRGDETITFPLPAWENISNPTLEQMQAFGFAEFVPEPPPPEPFESLKQRKKQEIAVGFDNSLVSKSTSYTTVGLANNITVNARERDLYNLEQLLAHMIDNDIPSTYFRCFDNSFAVITVADAVQIKKELRAFGLYLYQQKWVLEALIDSTTDDTPQNRADIEALSWGY